MTQEVSHKKQKISAKKKKKRISKHILQSRQVDPNNAKEGEQSLNNETNASTISSQSSKQQDKKRHEKHPKELESYLSTWKHRDSGSGWKFNKNTQSWLIRHMYNHEKVPKSMFFLLLEYLSHIKGKNLRERILSDANRRALRYKSWQESKDKSDEISTTENTTVSSLNVDDVDFDTWNQLNDHDKRKEYKRARKILEHLSATDRTKSFDS